MKNFMKVSGLAAPLILTTAAYFKIMHWPFAAPMLIVGFFVLCFFFLPSSVFVMYKEQKGNKEILLYVTGFIGVFLASISVLFKIMHWPGANWAMLGGYLFLDFLFMPLLLVKKLKSEPWMKEKLMFITGFAGFWLFESGSLFKLFHWPGAPYLLITGGILMVVVFFPWYAKNRFSKTLFVSGKFMVIVYAGMLLITLTMLLNINVSVDALHYMAHTSETLKNVNKYYLVSNQQGVESIIADTAVTDEQKQQVKMHHSSVSEIIAFTEEIKKEIIRLAGDQPVLRNSDNPGINYYHILNKSETDATHHVLFEQRKIFELKKMLRELTNNEMTDKNNTPQADILRIDHVDKWGNNWEQFYFAGGNLIIAMNNLSQVQKEVLNLENNRIINFKLNLR